MLGAYAISPACCILQLMSASLLLLCLLLLEPPIGKVCGTATPPLLWYHHGHKLLHQHSTKRVGTVSTAGDDVAQVLWVNYK
jgi:hypothetical protein